MHVLLTLFGGMNVYKCSKKVTLKNDMLMKYRYQVPRTEWTSASYSEMMCWSGGGGGGDIPDLPYYTPELDFVW